MAYNPQNPNGQATSANSSPVVIASDQSTLPVSGTVTATVSGTVAATQSGSWLLSANSGVDIGDVTINNGSGVSAVNIQDGGNSITVDGTFWQAIQPVSGTVTANIGTTNGLALDATLTGGTARTKITDGTSNASVKAASTAAVATDPALVVAISPNNSVAVTGTFWQATQPVSGTVTVTQATAANLNATVVGTGTFAVQAAQSGTWSVRLQDGSGNAITSATRGSERALTVQIVDASGTQVTSFGSGTQYADGAARGSATGTLMMVDDGTLIQSAAGTSAGLLKVDISGTAANATAIKVDGSAVTQPVSGTVTVSQATAANLNATVTGTVAATQSGTWNINNISGTVSLPTGAATSANQTTLGSQTTKINDGTNTAAVKAASTAAIATDPALVVAVSPNNTINVASHNVTNAGTFAVQATQAGTWNVGLNAGTNAIGSITNTSFAATQATASSLLNKPYGSVTTAAPTYTTGTDNALSLTTAGALRVDGSGATQPVSGTVTVSQATAANLNATVTGTVAATQSGTWTVQPGNTANTTAWLVTGTGGTFPVTGSITANIGTSGSLALDATLTGGTQKAIVRGGAKGTTTAADVTSTASGANRQPLDVAIYDAAGNQITSFGGGTQYADGAARGTATGTLLMVDDGTLIQAASGTSGGLLKVDISGTAANATAIKVDGSAVTQPISGSVTVSQATAANLNATVTGTVAATQSGTWNITNISGTVSLPTGAATSANQTTLGSQTTKINDGTNTAAVKAASTAAIATDPALVVAVSPNNTINVATHAVTQSGTWTVQPGNTANTTAWLVTGTGGTFPVTGTVTANIGTSGSLALDATLTGGTQKAILRSGAKGTTVAADVTSTASGVNRQPLDVAIYDAAGNQITSFGGGTQYLDGTAVATPTGTVMMIDDGTTVRSAIGTTGGILKVDLSSTTANATAIKVDGSAVTQPVSIATVPSHPVTNAGTFAVQAAQTGTWNVGLSAGANAIGSITNTSFAVTQATAANLNATVVGTGTFAVQADTELPAAAALSDSMANPTTPTVGSALIGLGQVTPTPLFERIRTTTSLLGTGANNSFLGTGILAMGTGPGYAVRWNSTLATAVASETAIQPSGSSTCTIGIGTTATGTFKIEGTADNITWYPVEVFDSQGGLWVTGQSLTPTNGKVYYVVSAGMRQIKLRVDAVLSATVSFYVSGTNSQPTIAAINSGFAPHNFGYSIFHRDAAYTGAQAGTILVPNISGKKIAVTDFSISAGGTTAGIVNLHEGATLNIASNTVVYRGEFAPSATSKPGVIKNFTPPYVTTGPSIDIRVTIATTMTVHVQINGYYI